MTHTERTTSDLASEHLNGFVLYGGMHVRRIDVIRHCRSNGVDEHSIGFFTLKATVDLTPEQATVADAEWARMLRIEALAAEGMTFSDAQACVDAEVLVA